MTQQFTNQLQPGMKVGKYQIVSLVATGGMAMVYKAYDKSLDRYVAIKQIAPNLAADEKFLERFRREAQVLARLSQGQQNVVAVYELVEENGGLFMVMEFVEGTSLQKLMERGPASLQTGLGILLKITLGLKAIHSQGIVHRDLKPDNIMVQSSGGVKIADFGLIGRAGGRTSLPMGTTQYMAPEMFTGGTVDSRADIYSLGFIAYQMFAGPDKFREAFSDIYADPQSASIRWMHWHSNPQTKATSLKDIQPGVPPLVVRIVDRMMEKDPSRRFSSADQILKWLRQIFVMYVQGKSLSEQDSQRLEQEVDADAEGRDVPAGAGAGMVPAMAGGAGVPAMEAPKTAPLPKRRWGWQEYAKYGGIAAGAVIALLVGLAVYRNSVGNERMNAAKTLFVQGCKQYEAGEFAKSVETMNEVMEKYTDIGFSHYAQFWKLLAQSELAAKSRNWDEAFRLRNAAADLIPNTSGPNERARQQTAARELENRLNKVMQYTTQMDRYKSALAMNRYDEAVEILQSVKEQGLAPSNEEIDTKIAEIQNRKTEAESNRLLVQGDEQLRQRNFDDAERFYRQARSVLDTPAVKERVGRVTNIKEFIRLRGLAEGEASNQKWDAAAAYYEQALKLQLSPEDSALVDTQSAMRKAKEALSNAHYKRGMELKAKGDYRGAMKEFEAAVDAAGNAAAQAEIEILKTRDEYMRELSAARDAWRKGDYNKAVEHLDRVIAMERDPDEIRKLRDMRADWTQIYYMREGDKFFNAKDYSNAQQAYRAASDANPQNKDRARQILSALNRIDEEMRFVEMMTNGKDALAKEDFQGAKRFFTEAKRIFRGRPEVDEALKDTEYEMWKKKGLEAKSAGRKPEALASFKLAQQAKNTEEIKKLIEEVGG